MIPFEDVPTDPRSRQEWAQAKRSRLQYLRARRDNDTSEIERLELEVGNVVCACGRAHADACAKPGIEAATA